MSEQPIGASSHIEQKALPEQLEQTVAPEHIPSPKFSETTEPNISQPAATTAVVPRPSKDPRTLEIEGILSSGLDQAYLTMPVGQRQKFRQVGEETAQSIRQLLDSGKGSWQKIQKLIMRWLRLIPGVNRYFLEKEAKLKADRLMNIR